MIVVDTNILAYRLLAGPKNGEVAKLVRLESGWAAPVLWRSEMRNLLAGYLRRGQLEWHGAEGLVTRAHGFLSAGEHMVRDSDVFDLVRLSNCTAYDCEFVALAQALGVPLITEDRALLRAFPKNCRSLGHAVQRGLS